MRTCREQARFFGEGEAASSVCPLGGKEEDAAAQERCSGAANRALRRHWGVEGKAVAIVQKTNTTMEVMNGACSTIAGACVNAMPKPAALIFDCNQLSNRLCSRY